MKRIILGIITTLLVTTVACIRIVPSDGGTDTHSLPLSANQQPVAYIDAIQPASASFGDLVTFNGHGTDADGVVVGYEWRSSLDGILSTVASFTSSTLSIGTHTVYFRVIDDKNLWSADVNSIVTVMPKVAKPVIESFTAVPHRISPGGSSVLSWSVSSAKTVTIDNGVGPVALVSSRAVYPTVTTVYTLIATNEAGSVPATVSLEVLAPTPVSGDPVIHYFTAQYIGGTAWQLQWSVSNATTVVIDPDVGYVNPSDSVVVNTPVNQTYRLRATNDWGWSWFQVTLMYQ